MPTAHVALLHPPWTPPLWAPETLMSDVAAPGGKT